MSNYKMVRMRTVDYEAFSKLADLEHKPLIEVFSEFARIVEFLLKYANTRKNNYFTLGVLKDEKNGVVLMRLLQQIVGMAEDDEDLRRQLAER